MNIFLNTQFSGLHQYTNLISLALVDENNNKFYAEFNDFDYNQIDDLVEETIINNLLFISDNTIYDWSIEECYIKNNKEIISTQIQKWLKLVNKDNKKIEVWGDNISYSWMLFNQLIKELPSIPLCEYPFDICTLFRINDIDLNINRLKFSNLNIKNNTALSKALITKACYEKLIKKDR